MSACRHKRTTWPRRDEEGEYIRCLDCAERIPWAWNDDLELKPPNMTAPVGIERSAKE